MNLLEFQHRPAHGAGSRNESDAIHLHDWIHRSTCAKGKIAALASPRGKGMNDPGDPAEAFGMKERYLRLTLYL
jgi:hypothetical protein